MTAPRLKVVVENDPFLRMVPLVLDPETSPEMMTAFADFFSHDVPDFAGWCADLRAGLPHLGGARVVLVDTQEEMARELPDCAVIVTESLTVGAAEMAAAPHLRAIQKYGLSLRNIDTAAATDRGIPVLGLRRRANIACAEHVMALMLALAKRITELAGKISVAQLAPMGYPHRPFDRRYTPGSNWARIPGVRMLHDSTIGIIGMGEIGKEVAIRARAFGMQLLYHQRTPLPASEEAALGLRYCALDALLARSDWIVPQLPHTPSTTHLLNRENLAHAKPGAMIVNVSRPGVIEREAILDGLRSGRIGGFGLDPQYQTPGSDTDELLAFPNVVLTPHIAAQPRFNATRDFEELFTQLEEVL
jgi:phosphoglycerate dehydrogenase-like enzyme